MVLYLHTRVIGKNTGPPVSDVRVRCGRDPNRQPSRIVLYLACLAEPGHYPRSPTILVRLKDPTGIILVITRM